MKKLQKKVKKFIKKHKLEHKAEVIALDLVSEIGEVAKEILESSKYGKKKPKSTQHLKEELGDAFYSLINLANYFDIDLESALNLVLKKYKQRIKKKGTASSKPLSRKN